MEYEKKDGKVIGKLAQKNVDTGAGLERITAVMQGKKTAYETDLFQDVFIMIKEKATKFYYDGAARIIADHARTAMFLIGDGVFPGNKDQGYVLRRLIRRALVRSKKMGLPEYFLGDLAFLFGQFYKNVYEEVGTVETNGIYSNPIEMVINQEEDKFMKTLDAGLKELKKGTDPFILFTTYGFPIELSEELYKEEGTTIFLEDFNKKMAEHQKLSQTSSAGMFKGGLANHNEQTIRLHTAHHLLLAALQETLGRDVKQRGSNITEERLRMDFAFDRKVTPEEIAKVESLVNGWIGESLPVVRREMPREEAEKLGAEMEFGAKYPDMVSVYFIGKDATSPSTSLGQTHSVSLEFCGGPHVTNTSELGVFKILKEEASSAGVRRIKAVLE